MGFGRRCFLGLLGGLWGLCFVSCATSEDQKAVSENLAPDTPEVAGETPPKQPGISAQPEATETESKQDAPKSDETSAKRVVTTWSLRVRSGPSMTFPVVDYLKKGDQVEPLGRENLIWVKIGEHRYVSSKHLSD